MINVLFAATEARWSEYEAPLTAACKRSGCWSP